jgi:hypothetical protein
MSGMCRGQNCQIQHVRNVSLSKMSDSACLECAMLKNARFSIAGMCCGQKCQIQYGWNVSRSKTSDSAFEECILSPDF